MSRPLRIEFAGGLYHVTSRGDGREAIYLTDQDRLLFLELLGNVVETYNWAIHAYCLMDNHYHLLIETPDGNLSQGMRQLNGVYTQRFNREHQRVGHVFQGRYKAIIVQKEPYLLEVARYIVLNPVRAHMVQNPGDWPWSNYRATAGLSYSPHWLTTDWMLSNFSQQRTAAVDGYIRFVAEGKNQPEFWKQLRNQIFLGSDIFAANLLAKLNTEPLHEIPYAQRRPLAKSLEDILKAHVRDMAILQAYASGAYTLKEIGEHFGLHYSRISRIVKSMKAKSKT